MWPRAIGWSFFRATKQFLESPTAGATEYSFPMQAEFNHPPNRAAWCDMSQTVCLHSWPMPLLRKSVFAQYMPFHTLYMQHRLVLGHFSVQEGTDLQWTPCLGPPNSWESLASGCIWKYKKVSFQISFALPNLTGFPYWCISCFSKLKNKKVYAH